MARRVPIAPLVVAALVLVVGCGPGNGGDTDPRTYAKAVCSGLAGWRQGITGDSTELSRALAGRPAAVATVKARYTRFFAGSVRRTDQLIGAVRRAGAPEVDNGLGYARDLTQALTQARTGLADAQARFAALPTDDLRSYAAGAGTIRDSLGTLFTGVGAALDRLGATHPDPDLNKAFRDEPDCQRLA